MSKLDGVIFGDREDLQERIAVLSLPGKGRVARPEAGSTVTAVID